MRPNASRQFLKYGLTILATAAAVLVRWLLDPWLGDDIPLAMLYGAIVFAVWYGGYRPGLLAVVLGYIACNFLFVAPHGAISLSEPRELARLTVYLASCAVILGLGERVRVARRGAKAQTQEVLDYAAEALRRSEQQLRMVIDALPAVVTYVDHDTRYRFFNRTLCEWFGLDPDSVRGRTAVEIMGERAYEGVRPMMELAFAGQHVHFETELPYRYGGARSVEVRYVPDLRPDGTVEGYIALVNDITERKQAETALRQSEERFRVLAETLKEADQHKDEFLATLAHELRNPLAPIRNSLHILRLAGGDSAVQERVAEMMERQVNHMVRLVDDLLEVSRISTGKIELRKEPVELAAVVRSAIESSRPLIEAAGHRLAVSQPSEPLTLAADPVRMTQVIANLLNNAAKFTADGGQIWLTARREGSDIVVSIRDNGVGIPADMLPKVFEMFTQVDPSPGRTHGGLGIGLTLVKRLVQMHGGTIEARSGGPGQGSEFLARLPAIAPEFPVEPEALRADGQGDVPPPCRRILVVDDNEDSAESLGTLLRLKGHDVQIAHEGEAALAAARAYRPEVVLLDIGMPGLDGYAVARRLRQEDGCDQVLLIALTGYGQDDDRRRSREAGFDDHLVKPIDLAALEALLQRGPEGKAA
jgi:PAS domain S-box-containing protein